MAEFELPDDLIFNRGQVHDAQAFAKHGASWLLLTGDTFAEMGGLAYAQVQAAIGSSRQIVSDPPHTLDLELARQHVAALDALPRPTLITCRMGPRSSAVAYMYAGLRAGAEPADVLAAAELDDAPFAAADDLKAWVTHSIEQLRR